MNSSKLWLIVCLALVFVGTTVMASLESGDSQDIIKQTTKASVSSKDLSKGRSDIIRNRAEVGAKQTKKMPLPARMNEVEQKAVEKRSPFPEPMATHGTEWWPYEVSAPYSTFSNTDHVDLDVVVIPGIIEFNVNRADNALRIVPSDLLLESETIGAEGYYLVKFQGPIYQEWLDELTSKGIDLYQMFKWFTYVARIPAGQVEWVASLPFVKWVGNYEPAYKIDAYIGKTLVYAREVYAGAPIKLEVSVFIDQDFATMGKVLESMGCEIFDTINNDHQMVFFVSVDPSLIPSIAQVEGVFSIREDTPLFLNHGANYEENPSVMELGFYWDAVQPYRNAGIDGTGQIVGINDSGLDLDAIFFADTTAAGGTAGPTHRKVQSYIAYGGGDTCNCADGYSHGSLTTMMAIGQISDFGYGHYDFGIAAGARVVLQDVQDDANCTSMAVSPPADLTASLTAAQSGGSFAMNYSWGGTDNGYDSQCADIDDFLINNRNFMVFASAGNSGPSANTVYAPSTNKNGVCVGGNDQHPYEDYYFNDSDWFSASVGPVATSGRRKPDVTFVCADSSGATGNWSNEGMPAPVTNADCSPWTDTPVATAYMVSGFGGTSFSSPLTMGGAAVIRDYFVDGWYPTGAAGNPSVTPSGMLIKAGLVASAEVMVNSARPDAMTVTQRPSNYYGFGRVNLNNILKLASPASGPTYVMVDDNVSLTTGSTMTYNVDVKQTTQPIRIALAWYDTTGNTISIDYDLTVTQGSNTWRGNSFAAGWSTTTGMTADRTNTVEAVMLNTGSFTTGAMTIQVYAYNAPAGNSPTYALWCSGVGTLIVGTLDSASYFCNGTVCGSINDTEGTPTNAYYYSTTGGAYGPMTISGSTPNFTVACATIADIGAADGDNIWLSFTGSDSNTHTSGNSVLDCSLEVCVYLVDALYGGCDDDAYHDQGEILDYNVGIANYEAFALPEGFSATLQLRTANPDVTILNDYAEYPALEASTYSYGDFPFYVAYDGPIATTCNDTLEFEVIIESLNPGNWDNSGCTAGANDFDITANWDLGDSMLDEDFDGGTWPPTGWTVTNEAGACDWMLDGDTNTPRGNNTGGTGDCATADSDDCNEAITTVLRTPAVNLTGYTASSIEFNHIIIDYYGTTTGYVQASTNGSTWTTLEQFDPCASGSGVVCDEGLKTYDLSSYTGNSTVYVRWRYYSNDWEMYWQVDDVKWTAGDPHCEADVCVPEPHFFYDQYLFDDSACNDDGVLDPGDVGFLSLYIGNDGSDWAYDTVGTLTCPTCPSGWGEICVLNNPATYGLVPHNSGYVFAPVDTFQIAIDPSLTCGTELTFQLSLTASNPYGPQVIDIPITVGTWEVVAVVDYEEHYLLEPETAGASGRVGFTTAWTNSANNRVNNEQATTPPACTAAEPFWHDSDGDGWQCRFGGAAGTHTSRHIFSMSGVDYDVLMNWEWDSGSLTTAQNYYLAYTDDGSTWNTLLTVPGTGGGAGEWEYCYAGSIYATIASVFPGDEDLIFNNTNFGIRFSSSTTASNYGWLDNIYIEGLSLQAICTSTPCDGTCPTCDPPTGLTNNTAVDLNGECVDQGVQVSWTADPSDWMDGSSGTRTYAVLRGGSIIQSGITYGTTTWTDTTGVNGTTYLYQVRYINGCGGYADTTGASAADYYNQPGAPVITAVNDLDACASTGVSIVFTAGSGAASHNLWV
ncbi:hypothetical protein JXQ70_16095, partial [bacterium]|nr:hypothetical protein [bacterium]